MAKLLLYNQSPFPLIRGRGIKGDGVTKQNPKGGEVDKHYRNFRQLFLPTSLQPVEVEDICYNLPVQIYSVLSLVVEGGNGLRGVSKWVRLKSCSNLSSSPA